MKRKQYIFFLLLVTSLSVFAQPKITFNEKTHDFGTISWDKPATASFTITNTGNKPLVITNVTTSCGCAIAGWTKEPIMPGKSGYVSSTYDAKALGRFHKTVGIYTNASNTPIYLVIRGDVSADMQNDKANYPFEIGQIRLDKNNIEFADAYKGESPTVDLLIANFSKEDYEPVLMHLSPYLKAQAIPTKIKKGGSGKIRLTLDTRKLKNYGLTQTTVYLARFPGDKVGEVNEIPVSAVLLPDFSHLTAQERENAPQIKLSETDLDMGIVGPNDKVSRTITITNTGKSKLDVRELQVFNLSVNVSLKKKIIQPGESTKLKVTLLGKYLKKVKNTPRVLIITNDPNQPKVTIKLKATTK